MKYCLFILLFTFSSCLQQKATVKGSSSLSRFQSIGVRIQTSLNQSYLNESYYNDIFYLNYVASLFPPQGSGIQATNSLIFKNDYLLVTYNTSKDLVRGGVDLISLDKMSLLDTQIFDDMEFSEIIEFNDYIVIGGQCLVEEKTIGCIVFTEFLDDKIKFLGRVLLDASYVTGIDSFDDRLLVSTGSNGTLWDLSIDSVGPQISYEVLSSTKFSNILDIKSTDSLLYLLYGDDKLNLMKYDLDNYLIVSDSTISNSSCSAPTKIHIGLNSLFINDCNGEVISSVDDTLVKLNVEGTPNGINHFSDYLLVAAGEKGLCAYKDFQQLIGCFDFLNDSGSANKINIRTLNDGSYVYVLSDGLGGVKVLTQPSVITDVPDNDPSFYTFSISDDSLFIDEYLQEIEIDQINNVYIVESSDDIEFSQSVTLKRPMLDEHILNFIRPQDSLSSNFNLLESDSFYQVEFLLNLKSYPESKSQLLSTDSNDGMFVVVDDLGQISLQHEEDRFLISDVSLDLNRDYHISITYNPTGKSEMFINGVSVASSTSNYSFEGGKLVLGSGRYFSFHGKLYQFHFNSSLDDNLASFSELAQSYTLKNPYDDTFNEFASLVIWLDGSDITSMNLQGSDLVSWQDKSNTNCLYESKAKQVLPSYNIDSVHFDGTNYLKCSQSNVLQGEAYTKVAVVELDNLNKKNNIVSSGVGNGHAFYMGDSNLPQLWHSHYRFNFSTIPILVREKVLIYSSYGNGDVENYTYINDRFSGTTPDVKPYDDNEVQIGAHGGGNNFYGKIYEIKAYNKSLNSFERNKVISDLMDKHNITPTDN